MPERRHHESLALQIAFGTLVALSLLLTACPSEGTEQPSRDFEVYRVVIADMLSTFAPEPAEPDEKPVIYLESFTADGVALEDQVDLVAAFEDDYELRFIDARAEAIDDDLAGLPVRVGGALFGLGPIGDDDLLLVRVERYVDAGDITAFRYRVGTADGWGVVGSPEEIPPEGFVTAP